MRIWERSALFSPPLSELWLVKALHLAWKGAGQHPPLTFSCALPWNAFGKSSLDIYGYRYDTNDLMMMLFSNQLKTQLRMKYYFYYKKIYNIILVIKVQFAIMNIIILLFLRLIAGIIW